MESFITLDKFSFLFVRLYFFLNTTASPLVIILILLISPMKKLSLRNLAKNGHYSDLQQALPCILIAQNCGYLWRWWSSDWDKGPTEASWGGCLQGCSIYNNSFSSVPFMWFPIFAFHCKMKKYNQTEKGRGRETGPWLFKANKCTSGVWTPRLVLFPIKSRQGLSLMTMTSSPPGCVLTWPSQS